MKTLTFIAALFILGLPASSNADVAIAVNTKCPIDKVTEVEVQRIFLWGIRKHLRK